MTLALGYSRPHTGPNNLIETITNSMRRHLSYQSDSYTEFLFLYSTNDKKLHLPHIVQVYSFKLKVVLRFWWWSGAEQVAIWSKHFEEEFLTAATTYNLEPAPPLVTKATLAPPTADREFNSCLIKRIAVFDHVFVCKPSFSCIYYRLLIVNTLYTDWVLCHIQKICLFKLCL